MIRYHILSLPGCKLRPACTRAHTHCAGKGVVVYVHVCRWRWPFYSLIFHLIPTTGSFPEAKLAAKKLHGSHVSAATAPEFQQQMTIPGFSHRYWNLTRALTPLTSQATSPAPWCFLKRTIRNDLNLRQNFLQSNACDIGPVFLIRRHACTGFNTQACQPLFWLDHAPCCSSSPAEMELNI